MTLMTITINLYCCQISTPFLYGEYTTVMTKTNNNKKKNWTKNLTFMANLEYKISESLPGTWWIFVTLCLVQLWLSSVHTNDGSYLPYVTQRQRRPKTHTLMSGKVGEKNDTQHLFCRGFFCPWMKYFLLHTYHELQNLPFHISFWPFSVLFLFLALY